MITIKMDENTVIDMLVDRVAQWTDDEDIIELYRKMYENEVYEGFFDNVEFDVMTIVDNDWVNNTDVVSRGDDNYDKILAWWKAYGCGYCADELDCCDYIEAEYNGDFLVRW